MACKECPYRKQSAPGYLGEASFNPELFLGQLDGPLLHPCHLSVDFETEDYSKASYCQGALQFAKNTCKFLGDNKANQLARELTIDSTEIFARRQDFIDHHSK